jgi:hypothetical protein
MMQHKMFLKSEATKLCYITKRKKFRNICFQDEVLDCFNQVEQFVAAIIMLPAVSDMAMLPY